MGRRGVCDQGCGRSGLRSDFGSWGELRRAQHWSGRHEKGPARKGDWQRAHATLYRGGRANLALGTKPTPEESGLGGLPIEADMRYTGGFMPYGAKEKADDVPARLSKNEFVFTADAVRAAGGGSVQKGAQRMYNTMKQLEAKPEAKGMMA